ncbi:Uncharacterized protein APZ42_000895, partial [Daphnia magna]
RGRIRAPTSALDAQSGFVCEPLESAAGQFCQLVPSARSACRGRIQRQLEVDQGLRLPSVLPNSEGSEQDHEGRSGNHAISSMVASPGMVPDSPGASERATAGTTHGRHSDRTARPESPACRIPHPDRLAVIREELQAAGVSEDVVQLLMEGTRKSTAAAYQSAWKNWLGWNFRQGSDAMSPSIGQVLEFLGALASQGKASRTINVYRSMLSSTLQGIEGVKIGKHPLVIRLLKGIYNRTPPTPRYTGFWDVAAV